MATSRLPPATPRLRDQPEIERDEQQTQEKEKEEKKSKRIVRKHGTI